MAGPDRALDWIDENEARYRGFWIDLVKKESPFWEKPGVDAVCDAVQDMCACEGLYTKRYAFTDHSDGLCACTVPFAEYRDGVALMAHMDTVQARGSFEPVVRTDDTYIYGPGCGDCKAGVAMALLTVAALRHAGYRARPIKLIFVGDEECGRDDAHNFYRQELAGTAAVFNAESGFRGQVVTGRKASICATYTIRGEAGHVGYLREPPKTAIREAAYKILELEKHSDYERLTFSCGEISGGTVFTSVPDRCRMRVNVRIRDGEQVALALAVLESVRDMCFVPGTTTEMELTGNMVPMAARPGNEWLRERYSAASESLGYGAFGGLFVGGASDAAYPAAMGIPVICATGPIVDDQHTKKERAHIASMRERARIHVKTICELPAVIPDFRSE